MHYAFPCHGITNRLALLCVLTTIVFICVGNLADGQVLITETFSDGDVEDSDPGLWGPIRAANGLFDVDDDGLFLEWTGPGGGYPMQLFQVDGEPVEPGANWSMRALLSIEDGIRGGVGVAPDDQTAGATVRDVNAAPEDLAVVLRMTNGFGGFPRMLSEESLPYQYGQPIFVQFDRTESLGVARMWLPGQPEQTITLMSDNITTREGTPGLFVTSESSALFTEFIADRSPLATPKVVHPPLTLGEAYVQDFNVLSDGGQRGAILPAAWKVVDNRIPFLDIRRTTEEFPLPAGFNANLPVVANAGTVGDRTLAVLKSLGSIGHEIHFLTQSSTTEANSFQVSFSIEAWERAAEGEGLGAAAFDFVVEIETESGYEVIADLGNIGTGNVLPSSGGVVDGNMAPHFVAFDSGVLPIEIPADSNLRFRWKSTLAADASDDWVFGVDDVSITTFFLGDFDNSGGIDEDDIDTLSAAIRAGSSNTDFDLNMDDQVTGADRNLLLDIGGISLGDTDLDGSVDFADFLRLSDAYGTGDSWSQGDFDGDGVVAFADFLALSVNFQGPASEQAVSVPEPSSSMMALVCVVLVSSTIVRRRATFGRRGASRH